MRITISCVVPDELVDADHEMGVTNEGYEAIVHALSREGFDDIDVMQA